MLLSPLSAGWVRQEPHSPHKGWLSVEWHGSSCHKSACDAFKFFRALCAFFGGTFNSATTFPRNKHELSVSGWK